MKEYNLSGERLFSVNIFLPSTDCKEAKRNWLFLSLLITNCTAPLHKLQTPSNNIIDCPAMIAKLLKLFSVGCFNHSINYKWDRSKHAYKYISDLFFSK